MRNARLSEKSVVDGRWRKMKKEKEKTEIDVGGQCYLNSAASVLPTRFLLFPDHAPNPCNLFNVKIHSLLWGI